jgi:hypothetical protein
LQKNAHVDPYQPRESTWVVSYWLEAASIATTRPKIGLSAKNMAA